MHLLAGPEQFTPPSAAPPKAAFLGQTGFTSDDEYGTADSTPMSEGRCVLEAEADDITPTKPYVCTATPEARCGGPNGTKCYLDAACGCTRAVASAHDGGSELAPYCGSRAARRRGRRRRRTASARAASKSLGCATLG